MDETSRIWFWTLAGGHLVLALLAVLFALAAVVDTAWDFRLVRRLKANGIYRAMTLGSVVRANAMLGLTLLLALGSGIRMARGTPYAYSAAPAIGYLVVILLLLQTASDWLIRRQVMREL